MASPGELVKCVSQALGIDETTVGNIYRRLREGGLVTKGGRGKSAATVTSKDAATLLLAICSSDSVKGAPKAMQEYALTESSINRKREWSHKEDENRARFTTTSSNRWHLDNFPMQELRELPSKHSPIEAISGFISFFAKPPSGEATQLILSDLKLGVSIEWPKPAVEIELYALDDRSNEYRESMNYFPAGQAGVYIDVRNYDAPTRKEISDNLVASGRDSVRLITQDLSVRKSFSLVTIASLGKLIRGDFSE